MHVKHFEDLEIWKVGRLNQLSEGQRNEGSEIQ